VTSSATRSVARSSTSTSYAVDQAQQIDVSIPVHLVGVEDLARDGGYMNQVRMVAPIRVRPSDVPDFIELSVAGMGIGDVKRLGDIVELLPGRELADDPDRVIVTINAPAGGGTGDASPVRPPRRPPRPATPPRRDRRPLAGRRSRQPAGRVRRHAAQRRCGARRAARVRRGLAAFAQPACRLPHRGGPHRRGRSCSPCPSRT
jgi:hypothetical protein